jgi:hypothetical protein
MLYRRAGCLPCFVLAGMSLVVFAATVILWVRSHFVFEHVDWSSSNTLWEINFEYGLEFSELSPWFGSRRRGWHSYATSDWSHELILHDDNRQPFWLSNGSIYYGRFQSTLPLNPDGSVYEGPADFDVRSFPQSRPVTCCYFFLPYWIAMASLLVLPVGTVAKWATERSWTRSRAVCAKCGYDLRASPSRCPECGTFAPEVSDTPADL